MEEKNETEVEKIETEVKEHDAETEEVKDTTDWKAKHDELAGRLKRAETKLEKTKIEKKVEEKLQEKTGELDETQLDYLDLKGISESEDIKVIEDIVKKTGMTVRQALKDEYVTSKLEANKQKRDVKNATPSKSNRGGNQTNDLAGALAKFDASGELPKDFALKTQVINAITERGNSNKPSWH